MTQAPDPDPAAAAEEQPYHVRATINPESRDALFLLQSKWQGITRRRVSLPTISQALLERALARPDLVAGLLDELRGQHPGSAEAGSIAA